MSDRSAISFIKRKIISFRARGTIDRYIILWPDVLGVLLLMLGVAGEITGPIPYPPVPGLEKLHHDLSSELISIGLAVLIIDNANQMLSTREEKKRLILQLGSPDHAFAVEAARMLSARGWLYDGTLREANLNWANLSGADLSETVLSKVFLINANLSGVNLSLADLRGAGLLNANLSGASLIYADLRGGYLVGTNLSEADLEEADLSGAVLEGAILSRAFLNCSNLSGADLRDAELDGAILCGANLIGAKVTDKQLTKAKSIEGAIMPDGTKAVELQPDLSPSPSQTTSPPDPELGYGKYW